MTYPRSSNLYTSVADKSTGVVTADQGSIKYITAINSASDDRFLQFYDSETTPPVGAVPFMVFPVYANNGYTEIGDEVLGDPGLAFDNGITWAFSTDMGTYQPAVITDAFVSIRWVA